MSDSNARKGLFIVLEGPDGAGKSVQARMLAERLTEHGLPVTYTQLVPDVIVPALERGDIVVLDRYATSTMAYQGYGSGVDRDVLGTIERLSTGGLLPDLVIVLDVPVEVGLARRDAGHVDELTRFEDESRHDLAFHQRVREGYHDMAAADPDRWVVLDGSGTLDEVAEKVSRVVNAILLQSGDHDAARKVSG